MALILSLESATTVCSVALHRSGSLVSSVQHDVPQSTASQLAVMIDHLFKSTGLSPSQLDAVAVSAGPGSYTGLRIGVATAKGLCYALDIPLIAVNTLELLAFQVSKDPSSNILKSMDQESLLCPMLDARRMEVYTLLARTNLDLVEPTDAKIIDELSYQSYLQNHRILFFGNGAAKCRPVIQHENAEFIHDIIPLASALGSMAYTKFLKKELEDLSSYEPFYLKDFLIKKPNSLV